MIIEDPNKEHYLHIKNGAMQCDGLEKFISELNHRGGTLFQDVASGKIFRIEELPAPPEEG